MSKQEIDLQTKEETVEINCDGWYEVCLPWADDKSPLPDNLHLAQRRLEYTTSKFKNNNLYLKCEEIFASWLKEGIIEEVPLTEIYSYWNYLPHRPGMKPSSVTTLIQPVFDALARLPNPPSLNQCLECGLNLIELLPDLLLHFR
ncbi:integrase catalytic domain-containing protein [Trichonephila clavipes]|nr:integrase catalytic domain-containing protein [Trichonephila clavipes]